MTTQYNILFIHTDEQRADTLGCYGNELVSTPNIDRLAEQGVTFEEGHCTHPLCTPSRGTLLTGRYPSAHGLWRNGIALPESEETIAEILRDEGYATGLLGKGHFGPYLGDSDRHPESVWTSSVGEEECWDFWREFDGPYYGFEDVAMTVAHGPNSTKGGHYGLWLEENHPEKIDLFYQENAIEPTDPRYNSWKSGVPLDVHSSNWVADRTIEFIEDHSGDRPFFGWVGIPDPHFPYDPPEPYCHRYDPEEVSLPVDPDGDVWGTDPPRYITYHLESKYGVDWREVPERKQREIIAHYYAMTDLVDDAVGRILESLEEQGVADDTVVVFTSDHGDWLGDHGLFQKGIPHTRELTRIPWIIRWPGVAEPRRRVTEPASHVDLVPTLLDAAGVTPPHRIQGDSLRPVLRGERDALRPFALVEHRHEAYRPENPYVEKLDDELSEAEIRDVTENWTDEDTVVKTVYDGRYRFSYVTGIEKKYGEIFDLEEDPDEMRNLWGSEPETRAELTDTLVEALVHADDPDPEREHSV